jgi:glycosyltransferase involved in cell wall biosynthesis
LTSLRLHGFTPFIAAPASLLKTMTTELVKLRIRGFSIEMQSMRHGPRLISQLVTLVRREQIDLIHSHSVIATLCAVPAANIFRGRRVVETCHGREFWREGKRVKGNYWLDRQASRFVDRIIAVSNAAAHYLHDEKGIPDDKIVVIHNGRDLRTLRPSTPGEIATARAALGLRDERMILLLGRLAREKGHASFLEALRLLGSQNPPIVAMFAGIGPLEDDLKAACNAKHLSGRVHFLGYRTDLQRLLAAADLIVLPSISEGLPLVAVETLAAARPIVATATGGTPEVVIDGQTGLLVPPNDPSALAQAIRRVLGDQGLASRLGTNGRLFVEQHFDVRMQIERTMALYRDLTSRDAPYSREAQVD